MMNAELHAILLTDIVDSTRITRAIGDAAAAELGSALDRQARELLRTWRGIEIDKSDGMLLLFGNVADATGHALAYHCALAGLQPPLEARAGLHFGAVILRPNDAIDIAGGAKRVEVDGLAKSVAARVMALARGGQTLLTAEAREALGPTAWRVKGLAEPFEVFEVGTADARFAPPPDADKGYRVVRRADLWLPLRDVAHSLPAERDPFVGRREPLAELAARFGSGARLVSVLGIGGSGKTRLATRFAWHWLGDFAGGAWFCDLSAARSLDGIVHAVAQGLDVPLGREDPVVQIGQAIAGRGACLVILDNFEQVARHAEEALGRWLDRAAEARVLVTAREVLGLAGESTLELAPLPLSDAVDLFRRRAAAAGAGPGGAAGSNSEDAGAVAELVELLDRPPLAIELAAARTRLMSPAALRARMDQRFQLIATTGGRRDRQATLRATFDWSWGLLAVADKAALAQLSVFEGGFTLEAAEAVLDLSGCEPAGWAVNVLQALVDKSFVRPAVAGRFGLLGTVQEYAAEHLRTPGRFLGCGPQALAGAQQRHGAFFASMFVPRAGRAAEADVENLVVACRRATARGDVPVAVETLDRVWSALELRGPFRAAADLAQPVTSMAGLSEAARARAELVAASASDACGNVTQAHARFDAALAAARTSGDRRLETRVLIGLGTLHANQARIDEALTCLRIARASASEIGDRILECAALNGLGTACVDQGKMDEAYGHYSKGLAIACRIGDRRWEGGLLGNLGGLLFDRGELDKAAEHLQASLVVARELGNRMWEGNAMCSLGALHQVQGRVDKALAESAAALAVAQAIGHVRLECVAHCNLGLAHSALGRWDDARSAFDAALALARDLHDSRSEGLFLGYLARLHANQSRIDQARECLEAGGRLLQAAADRYSFALLMCNRVEVEWRAGDAPAAHLALASARAIQEEIGSGSESELGIAVARVMRMAGFITDGNCRH